MGSIAIQEKIHSISAAGRLDKLDAPKLFSSPFFHPTASAALIQRELQAALIGMSKQYHSGAMPPAGMVCSNPQARHHSLKVLFHVSGLYMGKQHSLVNITMDWDSR